MNKKQTILVTGGAGFIGSHLIRRLVSNYQDYTILNLDKLTYAGNLENLKDIERAENYQFLRGDIADINFVKEVFDRFPVTGIIHLAAESHVDRSISGPSEFIRTNIVGTLNLLLTAKDYFGKDPDKFDLFYHISTDEVYGSLGEEGFFTEETRYDPRSPYSASKAGSDHLVRAFYHTYQLPVVISNCSNNYGPNQFPEKLIPLIINNIMQNKPLPVYGKGLNIRDWLYVEDHAEAIDLIYHKGKKGETYNIGGLNEWKNIDLVEKLCDIVDEKLHREPGSSRKLISFVKDRAGHDLRYAIDCSKLSNELKWEPRHEFTEGLFKTVDWYLDNQEWLEHVVSGSYENYYREQYLNR